MTKKKLKPFVVSASFTQYSDGETIIYAKNLKGAQAHADELTAGDFEEFNPVDGELSVDDVCEATPEVMKLHAEADVRRLKDQRLHDAAEEMLAALKEAMPFMLAARPKAAQNNPHACFKWLVSEPLDPCDCAICQARAAIAKAEAPHAG